MPSGIVSALGPTSLTIENGQRIYRSYHLVSVSNDTDADIDFSVMAGLSDDAGHSIGSPATYTVLARQSLAPMPIVLRLNESNYSCGRQVNFQASTVVSGGLLGRAAQQTTVMTRPCDPPADGGPDASSTTDASPPDTPPVDLSSASMATGDVTAA